jgi:PAS domain S-box-containing protein
MEIKPLTKTKKTDSTLFFNEPLQKEFHEILLFLSEVGTISDAFITIIGDEDHLIIARIGLESLSTPYEISCFENFVNSDQIFVISDIKKELRYQALNIDNTAPFFEFFAGFPIKTPDLITGTLCILNRNSREFSSIELKIIQQSVSRIASLLQLHSEKIALQDLVSQNRRKFKTYEENSNEILFQINPEGIFTYVSKNWTVYLGHEVHEVIGKSYSQFIHPEDMESWQNYLSTITLNHKNTTDIVYRVLYKNGRYVWHTSRIQLIEKDKLPFYIGNCSDITEFVDGEQKLMQQKDFYETILNNLPTDVVVFDADHKYVYLNPVAIKNDELRKFIIGKDDFEYAIHMGRDSSSAIMRNEKFILALQNKNTSYWEETLNNAKDGITYHSRKFTPVFNADGTFKMMIGFSVNITESKKIQQQILESRKLTENILNNTAVGILVQGPDSAIIENNIAARELLGLTQEQLVGKILYDDYWQIIHEDGTTFKAEDLPVVQCIKHLKPVSKVVMGIHRPTTKDLVWLLVDAIPIFGSNSELLYVICSFNDITTQKNAEEALKISNERFTYATKATSDVIWDWEVGSENIIVGENYTKLFGHKINNKNNFLKFQDFNTFIHPDDLERNFENFLMTLKSKAKTWSAEFRFLKSDGSYAYIINKSYIIRDENNKAIRLIGAHSDVTIEKKINNQLRISEQKFKGAFEHSAIGMAIVNFDGYWTETNTRLCEILGYSKEELKKLTFMMLTHPDDLGLDIENKRQLDLGFIENFTTEKRYIHKNKAIIWVQLSVSVIRDSEGAVTQYMPQIIDITDRKKTAEENELLTDIIFKSKAAQLNKAKNMYQLLADNTVDLVCLHNLDGTFQYVSPSVDKLLGYNPLDLIGKSPLEFTHPEDLEHLQSTLSNFITEKEEVAAQIRLRNKAGHYIWFESKANLVKINGSPVSFHSGTREITTQKEAEESIKKSLNNERKLNELRTNLVSTISHEFRTPMTTIRTSAELIEMYVDGQTFENSDRLQKHLYTITNEIDRIVDLMNTVLTISKDDAGKTNFHPIHFDLKQICMDVIESSYSNQKDGRQVITNIQGNAFTVLADKNLMEYTLFNLLNNAFKYSAGSGDVKLNLFIKETMVIVEIIDFGIGIPKADQRKLFNTFFRAKNTDGIQGTGLGLYIVKTFTEKNSGGIKLESKLGKGTKVTLEFPLYNRN